MSLGSYDAYLDNLNTPTSECSDCGESHGERCAWLNTCEYCAKPTDDYESTAKDAKLVNPERKCEECHAELVAAAKRQKRDRDEDRDEYDEWLNSMSRRDAAYYASGENWRGE